MFYKTEGRCEGAGACAHVCEKAYSTALVYTHLVFFFFFLQVYQSVKFVHHTTGEKKEGWIGFGWSGEAPFSQNKRKQGAAFPVRLRPAFI